MEALLDKMKRYYPDQYETVLKKAYDFAEQAHKGQKRASGEEYFTHPVAVAHILADLGLDVNAIAAGLLHDVVEDTIVTEEMLRAEFGVEITDLVNGVTKLDKLKFKTKEEEQAENLRKMFFAMAKDIRVILIKLADRLNNMRTLNYLPEERRLLMAKETLDIYAPLAGRLGISPIKCELEDLCFRYLNPTAYYEMVDSVALKRAERQKLVDNAVGELFQMLKELEIDGEVSGRPKHLYSIYKKMKDQNKAFDQIYDLIAIRVIVKNVKDCYNILGQIHTRWKPVPGRIKDYIAMPKPNMYQSLHTTVVTNFGEPFEIQIRTYEMHRVAEYGIAAHWKYKEGRTNTQNGSDDLEERLTWIREIMEWQGDLKDAKEFLESLKGDIFGGEVLVFTPKGDVISLPTGSTPIDFAYHIHSQIGNKCVGAKINSKMVPLSTQLENGDVVEVVTSQNAKGPSWDWIKIVKSTSTKTKIRQFFRREMKEDNVKKGRTMLEKEAKRKGYVFSTLMTQQRTLDSIMAKYSFQNIDEIYAAIGYGAFTTNQILLKLIDAHNKELSKNAPLASVVTNHSSKNKGQSVVIKGGYSDFLVRFAGCCNPVPGDEIIGYISRGRGVSIHRADCSNIKHTTEQERLIEADWIGTDKKEFVAGIQITAKDSPGLFGDIANIVSTQKLSIHSINARVDKNKDAIITMTVQISEIQELEILITKISRHPHVTNVFRTRN